MSPPQLSRSPDAAVDSAAPLRVALVERIPPHPQRDGANRADLDLLDGLARLGHRAEMFALPQPELPGPLAAFRPDIVVCSRQGAMLTHGVTVRALGVPVIFLGHDLASRRLTDQSRFDRSVSPSVGRMMQAVEEQCWALADWSVYPDPAEVQVVRDVVGDHRAGYFPYFSVAVPPAAAQPAGGRDLFFVGGSGHGPNRDGINWFVASVWPELMAALPDVRLRVCGRWDPSDLPAAIPPGVEFTGALDEEAMLATLRRSAAAIAPLRFGAGVKRKVVEYLANGVPTVTTTVGTQGLVTGADGEAPMLVADGVQEWVDAVALVLTDRVLRRRLVDSGRALVCERYSPPVYLGSLAALLRDAAAAFGQRASRSGPIGVRQPG